MCAIVYLNLKNQTYIITRYTAKSKLPVYNLNMQTKHLFYTQQIPVVIYYATTKVCGVRCADGIYIYIVIYIYM